MSDFEVALIKITLRPPLKPISLQATLAVSKLMPSSHIVFGPSTVPLSPWDNIDHQNLVNLVQSIY